MRDVVEAVGKHYGVSREELISKRREPRIVRPRQVAMYLIKNLTARRIANIASHFGDKHHTTVMHSIRLIAWLIGERDGPAPKYWRQKPVDEILRARVERLKGDILQSFS
jgi:chromosomal replication initiation ATPase DnaA